MHCHSKKAWGLEVVLWGLFGPWTSTIIEDASRTSRLCTSLHCHTVTVPSPPLQLPTADTHTEPDCNIWHTATPSHLNLPRISQISCLWPTYRVRSFGAIPRDILGIFLYISHKITHFNSSRQIWQYHGLLIPRGWAQIGTPTSECISKLKEIGTVWCKYFETMRICKDHAVAI